MTTKFKRNKSKSALIWLLIVTASIVFGCSEGGNGVSSGETDAVVSEINIQNDSITQEDYCLLAQLIVEKAKDLKMKHPELMPYTFQDDTFTDFFNLHNNALINDNNKDFLAPSAEEFDEWRNTHTCE